MFDIGDIFGGIFLLNFIALSVITVNNVNLGEHAEDGTPVVVLLADFVVMNLDDFQIGQPLEMVEVRQ
jgi:hypothetical protein